MIRKFPNKTLDIIHSLFDSEFSSKNTTKYSTFCINNNGRKRGSSDCLVPKVFTKTCVDFMFSQHLDTLFMVLHKFTSIDFSLLFHNLCKFRYQ